MVEPTNKWAASEGAGTRTYKDWAPFDVSEIYKMFEMLCLNPMSPKPQFEYWFFPSGDSKIFSNDFFKKALEKKLMGGRIISTKQQWKHFCQFMCMYDFHQDPKKLHEKDPLWKVATIMDELQKNSQRCWLPGKWLAIDKETIGFKDAHGLALCISYKREGNGYQCDAVCENGYTFLFYFCHGNAPTLPPKYNDLELLPTGRQVIFLMMQLPNVWSHIFMDNLFNSRKLFTAAYRAKALCHGVVRSYGLGVPKAVIMKEEKNVKEADRLRNWTKAAVLQNAEDCLDLICCSVYDTKPVHIMSTVAEYIE